MSRQTILGNLSFAELNNYTNPYFFGKALLSKRNVLFVFGTRPEAIKLAPIINFMKSTSRILHPILCVTGQHKQMLDPILRTFHLNTDYNLSVMRPNQSLSEVTSRILRRLPRVMESIKPRWVVVQGDTNSALSAALCAFYYKIPIAHVEAGLRTGNILDPFPEEANRKIITSLASQHFAPTRWAGRNLRTENVPPHNIHVTGNSGIDALQYVLKNDAHSNHVIFKKISNFSRIILITAHRRENFGDSLQNICNAVKLIAVRYPNTCIVYPLHPNPNILKPVMKILGKIPNIFLIGHLDYETFVRLMKKSYIIMTDSGGIQEEAPSLQIPVLLMRKTTERPEGVRSGVMTVIGTRKDRIFKEVCRILDSERRYKRMQKKKNPYGDGKASARIVHVLERSTID